MLFDTSAALLLLGTVHYCSGLLSVPSKVGICSYYGREVGRNPTASGELFNWNDFTAAHKMLPFGTLIQVVNGKNKKAVVVRINDRGPHVAGRIVDLSYAAAKQIGMVNDGIVPCSYTILDAKTS